MNNGLSKYSVNARNTHTQKLTGEISFIAGLSTSSAIYKCWPYNFKRKLYNYLEYGVKGQRKNISHDKCRSLMFVVSSLIEAILLAQQLFHQTAWHFPAFFRMESTPKRSRENHWNQLANYEKIILNHAIPTCQKSGYASWHVINVESLSLHTNSSNCLKKDIWAHQLFNFTRSSAFCQ